MNNMSIRTWHSRAQFSFWHALAVLWSSGVKDQASRAIFRHCLHSAVVVVPEGSVEVGVVLCSWDQHVWLGSVAVQIG